MPRHLAGRVFDTDEGTAFAGARATHPRSRRVLYESNCGGIDFEIRPCLGQRVMITGQLRAHEVSIPARVHLMSSESTWDRSVDRLGLFEFGPLRHGDYAMSVNVGDVCIDLPTLVI